LYVTDGVLLFIKFLTLQQIRSTTKDRLCTQQMNDATQI
jgi:hypothetical protein